MGRQHPPRPRNPRTTPPPLRPPPPAHAKSCISSPRPAFTPGKTEPVLAKSAGLLQTAWPALGNQIESEFQSWQTILDTPQPLALAAASQTELFPSPPTTRLYRLPAGFIPTDSLLPNRTSNESSANPAGPTNQAFEHAAYERTAGSLHSRLQGVAIHAFLEELTRLRQTLAPAAAAAALDSTLPKVIALLRSRGLAHAEATSLAHESLAHAHQVLNHPIGSWITNPHPEASTESRWSGLISTQPVSPSTLTSDQTTPAAFATTLRHLRPDRVFLAPPHSGADLDTNPTWWIIDYKTAHLHANQASEASARQRFLETHRNQHAAQLHAYAQLLRGLIPSGSATEIRAGLFYPRLLLFDSWPNLACFSQLIPFFPHIVSQLIAPHAV